MSLKKIRTLYAVNQIMHFLSLGFIIPVFTLYFLSGIFSRAVRFRHGSILSDSTASLTAHRRIGRPLRKSNNLYCCLSV